MVPGSGEGVGSSGDDDGVVADQLSKDGAGDVLDEVVERCDAGGFGDAVDSEAFAEAVGTAWLAGGETGEQPWTVSSVGVVEELLDGVGDGGGELDVLRTDVQSDTVVVDRERFATQSTDASDGLGVDSDEQASDTIGERDRGVGEQTPHEFNAFWVRHRRRGSGLVRGYAQVAVAESLGACPGDETDGGDAMRVAGGEPLIKVALGAVGESHAAVVEPLKEIDSDPDPSSSGTGRRCSEGVVVDGAGETATHLPGRVGGNGLMVAGRADRFEQPCRPLIEQRQLVMTLRQ